MQIGTIRAGLAGLAAMWMAVAPAAGDPDRERAHLVVTDEVVNADLQPFAFSVAAFGNGTRLVQDGGFEPLVFRTMLQVTADASDRIIVDQRKLSSRDSWAPGVLDGATVDILRIENGAFQLVRQDRVVPGGHQFDGWWPIEAQKIVPQDQTGFTFAWNKWNRPSAPYYFTVRAVDHGGALSPAAPAVSVTSPDKIENTKSGPGLKSMKLSDAESRKLQPPEDLKAVLTPDGRVALSWQPVRGAVGYAIFRSDTPPADHQGNHLVLEGDGPTIRAGDLAILRKAFTRADRGDLLSNRVWTVRAVGRQFSNALLDRWSDDPDGANWHLVPHEPGTPVEEPGQTFLRLDLDQGKNMDVGLYNHSGQAQEWYVVLDPDHTYRVEAWMRGTAVKPVQFMLRGVYMRGNSNGISIPPFPLTSDWKKYSTTFKVPQVDTGQRPGRMFLRVSGPGQVDIDNFRIFRDDVPFLAVTPEDADRITRSGMGALRMGGLTATGKSTYDLEQLTNPGGLSRARGSNTLPHLLKISDQLDIDPWIKVEPHLSPQEWLGLMEFLAAPFDPATDSAEALPWAAKRHAQGQAAPWVDQFDRIIFEMGNEIWNSIFRPWTFPRMTDQDTGQDYTRAEVHGLYQEYVLEILRQSPYWPRLEPKFESLLGGWHVRDYGVQAAAMSPETDMLTWATYVGGWDEAEGPPESTPQGFSSVLTYVLQSTLPRTAELVAKAEALSAGRSKPLLLGTYEAGPGYAKNGMNGERVTKEQTAIQEEVMKSVASGTAALDSFLAQARAGFVLQNYFAFGPGRFWTSYARWDRGGQNFPGWELLSLFNREALGDMLAVEIRDGPVIDLPKQQRRQAVRGAPLVDAYATRRDDRLAVVLISRRVPGYPDSSDDGSTEVSLDLPILGADRLTLHRMSGRYDSHNVHGPGTELISEAQTVPPDLPRLNVPELPPGETLVFVFEGVRWDM